MHNDGIIERPTDGYKPVKGHDAQKKAFSATQGQENEKLDHAASIADHLPGAADVDKHLGDCARGVAQVQQGQVREEKVHGGVEFGIQAGHKNYRHIPKDGQDIGHQKHHKEWQLQPWPI